MVTANGYTNQCANTKKSSLQSNIWHHGKIPAMLINRIGNLKQYHSLLSLVLNRQTNDGASWVCFVSFKERLSIGKLRVVNRELWITNKPRIIQKPLFCTTASIDYYTINHCRNVSTVAFVEDRRPWGWEEQAPWAPWPRGSIYYLRILINHHNMKQ